MSDLVNKSSGEAASNSDISSILTTLENIRQAHYNKFGTSALADEFDTSGPGTGATITPSNSMSTIKNYVKTLENSPKLIADTFSSSITIPSVGALLQASSINSINTVVTTLSNVCADFTTHFGSNCFAHFGTVNTPVCTESYYKDQRCSTVFAPVCSEGYSSTGSCSEFAPVCTVDYSFYGPCSTQFDPVCSQSYTRYASFGSVFAPRCSESYRTTYGFSTVNTPVCSNQYRPAYYFASNFYARSCSAFYSGSSMGRFFNTANFTTHGGSCTEFSSNFDRSYSYYYDSFGAKNGPVCTQSYTNYYNCVVFNPVCSESYYYKFAYGSQFAPVCSESYYSFFRFSGHNAPVCSESYYYKYTFGAERATVCTQSYRDSYSCTTNRTVCTNITPE